MSREIIFAKVGKVAGLGSITEIPNSGYARQVAVEPGCGYVAKFHRVYMAYDSYGKYEQFDSYCYARIYVVDWTKAVDSGGIIGAEIKYQSPFVLYPSIPEELLE